MRLLLSKFTLLWWLFSGATFGAGGARLYDFSFKQMDIRKIILSIAALEKRSVQFTQSVTPRNIDVSLRQVTPAFALKLLTDSYGYVYILKGNVYHVMTQGERGPTASPMILIPMKNVLVADIEDNVRTFIGSVGVVSTNKSLNALVISAPEEVIAKLRPIVEALDQETQQVYIEAKIIETSTNFSRSLGIQWGPNVEARPAVNGVSFSAPGTNDTLRVGFTSQILGSQLSAKLTAGEQNGDVKVISQPKITTLNGVPANISSNITFNIRTLAGTGAAASNVGSIQQVKAGLQLQVTPYIVSSTRVRLQIQVTKSDPDDSSKIDGIPGVTDSSASTSLIVDSGQVASIGGLVTNRNSTTEAGIPFLSRLPIIGGLFGSVEKGGKETELMIFLVPSVYRGSAKVMPFGATSDEVSEATKYVKPEDAATIQAAPAAPAAAPAAPDAPLVPPAAPAASAPKGLISPSETNLESGAALAPKEGSLLPPLDKALVIPPDTLKAAPPPAAPPPLEAAKVENPKAEPAPQAAITLPPIAPTTGADLLLPAEDSLLPQIPPGPAPNKAPILNLVPPSDKGGNSLEGALLQLPALAPQAPAAPAPAPGSAQALQDLLGPIGPIPGKAPAAPPVAAAPASAPAGNSKVAPVAPSKAPPP